MGGEAKRRKNADGSYKYFKGSEYRVADEMSRIRTSGKLLMKYNLVDNKKVRGYK